MNQILAALLLVLISSHIAISISIVEATEYPYTYTSPPSYYKYESPPPPRYKYESPPPPAPPASPPFMPPPPPFKAVVTGNVYCDICMNGKLNKPLKGVTVGVFCWNGKSEDSFYGTTNDTGTFNIELKGFDFVGCGGAKACAALLISANYSTPCTQPTNKHGGQKGARLHVKAKSEDGVTLKAGSFAYTPISKHPKCYDHSKAACPTPPPPPKCPPPARPGPCPPPPNPPPCRPPPPPNCPPPPPPPPPPKCPPNPCPPPPPPPPCPSPPPYKYESPPPPSF